MARTSISTRATYLKLLQLTGQSDQVRTRFINPVLFSNGMMWLPFPTRDGAHGYVESVEADTLTLIMTGPEETIRKHIAWPNPAGTDHPPVDASFLDKIPDLPLTIPLELVRAAWRDSGGRRFLNLALEATILGNGSSWWLMLGLPQQAI